MIKFGLLYLLFFVSLAFPPLLLVTIPLIYLYIRGIARRRRAILDQAEAIMAQRQVDQTVKFFR